MSFKRNVGAIRELVTQNKQYRRFVVYSLSVRKHSWANVLFFDNLLFS